MGFVHAKGFRQLPGHILDQHPQPAAHDAAVLPQLPIDIDDHIDRHGERHAHEAPGAAVNLRVDPDDLALEVEQGAAGVAWIDGHIGLNEGNIVFIGQAPANGADDPLGDRVVKAKGRAYGQHPLPHFQTG